MRSAAYDLSQFAPDREPKRQPRVEVVRQPREVAFRKKLLRLRMRCAFLVALTFLLMFVTVNSRTELNETTADIQRKSGELVDLQSEYIYLNYQLESLVSLRTAEEYAKNELGLIKLDQSQIEYVNLQDSNSIETSDKVSGFMPFARYLFSAVIEMFS